MATDQLQELERSPTWDVAYLFPDQGAWTEADYLALTTNRLVELGDGNLEVLPMPTMEHQLIVLALYRALLASVEPQQLGVVLVAPFRIKLWEGKFREPDIMFLKTENSTRIRQSHWDGADLVMEVISLDDPRHDVDIKRSEYARAGIPEYWIADPSTHAITVYHLPAGALAYDLAGQFGPGSRAASVLLPAFAVDVNSIFARAILPGGRTSP